MLLTPHTVVGVAIAMAIPNPLIAVPVAFVFHFLGDLVPHWDFYSNTKREERLEGWRPMAVMGEMAIGVAVGVYFTLHALWVMHNPALSLNIFLCGIASVLPDVITGPSIYIKGIDSIFDFVHKLQHKLQFQAPLPWGVISQFAVMGLCLLLIASLGGL